MAYENRRMPSKWLPVLVVLCLYVFLGGVFAQYHLMPMLQDLSSSGLLQAYLFGLAMFMLIWTYITAVFTKPGAIPEEKKWDYTEEKRNTFSCQEQKSNGKRRNCKHCDKFKPDRTHHCRVCNTCVLKMDHHCPWINNCVGFHNYKYFILLVFYASVCTHFMTWGMIPTLCRIYENSKTGLPQYFVVMIIAEITCGILMIFLSCFLAFHIWLSLKPLTTIEFCEKRIRSDDLQKSKYDLGTYGNIKATLGPHMIFWLLPICPPRGNGIDFIGETTRLKTDIESGKGCSQRQRLEKMQFFVDRNPV